MLSVSFCIWELEIATAIMATLTANLPKDTNQLINKSKKNLLHDKDKVCLHCKQGCERQVSNEASLK